MAVEEIVRYGDETLRKPAAKVKKFDDDIRRLIERMYEVMKDSFGLGLAAPQIGVGLQVFTYDIGEGPNAFVNPKIVRSKGEQVAVEGCLSIPGIQGDVPRAEHVTLSGLDENGIHTKIKAEGLLARVFQHEMDHLQGRLFIDRADPESLHVIAKSEESKEKEEAEE